MGSYQKAPQKGITKLQYLLRGSFVLLLFQLTIIGKLKSLFETKRKESIAGLVVIALVLIFGIKKLTTDPLDGTYEILTKRDHLVMVIKGNAGTVISEDSDGDKEKRLVKIDKQKKVLTITDDEGREIGKTKYMLKDKELYLQEPNQTFSRVK